MRADQTTQFPGCAAAQQLYVGSRSTVYRARRVADDQPVILKVACAAHTTLEESLARFRHEQAILARIRSDHVIRAFDVATLGHQAALVVRARARPARGRRSRRAALESAA